MTKDDHHYTLSRRKVLGGLGAVGLASAGAGLGTTAYFSDTESFRNNTLEAGRLNLRLDWRGQYNDQDVLGIDPDDAVADDVGLFRVTHGSVDGPSSLVFDLADLAPGDKALVEVGFVIDDNPSRLWMRTRPGDDLENGYTEPEPTEDTSLAGSTDPAFTGRGLTGDFNAEGDPAGQGELGDELELHVSHTDGTYSQAFDTYGPALDIDTHGVGYLDGRGDVGKGSLRRVVGTDLAVGVPLSRDPTVPDDVFDPAPSAPNPNNASVTFEFEIPTAVENNVQTDSYTFSVDFAAGQARHDETNLNPFSP